MSDTLLVGPRSLAVFLDETGSEDYSDPAFPVFGYGGCAAVGSEYKKVLAKPWKRLKRERLGGANKPFHTAEFQKTKPTPLQISSINQFVKNPFFRFAAITSIDTKRSGDITAHKAVAVVTTTRIKNIVGRSDVDSVALVFEDTDRNRQLIAQDFDPNALDAMRILNVSGLPVEFNGYFLSKKSCTPGLEVADLVVHTAGRQERLKRAPVANRPFQPDFIELFHGVDEKFLEYISVDSVVVNANQ